VAGDRGVRADLVYGQSAKETNFGRFTGVVPFFHHNPCGLKVTEGGSNNDPDAHAVFPNWTTGVTACVDHLALYAGAATYPRASSPDPRHFPYLWGSAPTAEALGTRWAPSATYGTSLVQDYLVPMLRTQPGCRHPFVDVSAWADASADWAFCENHMSGYPGFRFKPDNEITRAETARLVYRIAGSPPPGTGCGGLTDVPAWAHDAICWLVNQGHATGYDDNTFRPDNPISRGEVTRMLFRVQGSPPGSPPNTFRDVPAWITDAVDWIADPARTPPYATGYPGNLFKPDNDITRAENTRMTCRINTTPGTC
jgi:hypothetical protein